MNYYIAFLLVACIGPSVYSANVHGVIIGFWAWGIFVMAIASWLRFRIDGGWQAPKSMVSMTKWFAS